MFMNIRFNFLLITICASSILTAADYTGKQKAILLLNALHDTPWTSTAAHYDIDPLFILKPSLLAHPGLPAFATFFCMRNPRVVEMPLLIDQTVFEETSLAPFLAHTQNLTLQEHICGLQFGQIWHQENFDIGWNWWVGARERNWWLSEKERTSCGQALAHYTASLTKQTHRDRYAAAEPQHRLTYWHATGTTFGIGDIHLYLRYRIPLSSHLYCSAGVYATIPVGTRAARVTPLETEDTHPLTSDELAVRLINRARDCMLHVPLGSNGHLGLGAQLTAGLRLSSAWSLRGQVTQLYYRSGIESRFSLTPKTALTKLEEGLPGTMEGISADADITAHLKQKLYPCDIKVEVKPGMLRTASVGLHYESSTLYGAIGYLIDTIQSEYSETAPLATLTRMTRSTQRITGSVGIRRRYNWGESSWYMVSTYGIDGSAKDAWSFGIGVTVQG
jgi:hypothetical protein